MNNSNITMYSADTFMDEVNRHIKHTDIALDIGCGIVPMNYFRPALHIVIEPHKEYVDILLHRHVHDKSVFILNGTAQDLLPHFTPNSIDSVFLLDVIEHLEKQDGFELLRHVERIAREQIVIFTPLGFMPQHADQNETDGWGLHGTAFQEHLSGWLPEDFSEDWTFHICETFHQYDFQQRPLANPYGAMFAIRSFNEKPPLSPPPSLVDIRRPLPSELALAAAQSELAAAQSEIAAAQRILSHPLIRAQRKLWRMLRFWK